jgi:hypothetical protein
MASSVEIEFLVRLMFLRDFSDDEFEIAMRPVFVCVSRCVDGFWHC